MVVVIVFVDEVLTDSFLSHLVVKKPLECVTKSYWDFQLPIIVTIRDSRMMILMTSRGNIHLSPADWTESFNSHLVLVVLSLHPCKCVGPGVLFSLDLIISPPPPPPHPPWE